LTLRGTFATERHKLAFLTPIPGSLFELLTIRRASPAAKKATEAGGGQRQLPRVPRALLNAVLDVLP
jgi:hypothetical protein